MFNVQEMAKLARLDVDPKWAESVEKQLEQVFQHFQQLQEVETAEVEPLVTPVEMDMTMREDLVVSTEGVELGLEQAPEKMGRLYKVPPVV